MAGEYNRFVRSAREATAEAQEPISGEPPVTQEELAGIQERNLREWKLAYGEAKSEKAKRVLRDQLKAGLGTEFPAMDAPGVLSAGGPLQFSILRPTEASMNPDRPSVSASPLKFSILKPAEPQPEPVPDAGTGVGRQTPIGFAETPGGAVTGLRMPRVAEGRPEAPPGLTGPEAGRIGLEVAGATGGAILGGRFGQLGMRAGEALGTAGGSLLAETFDPTARPGETAMEAGGATMLTGAAASGGAALFRKMLGNPTEAGKRLIAIAEKRGEVPLPGAVLEEGSLASKIQAIGQADVLTGQRIAEKAQQIGQYATQDVSQYINDYLRVKATANKAFQMHDDLMLSTFGNNRVVYLPPTTLDALEPILKVWETRGLAHQFDPTLLRAAQSIRGQVDAAAASGGRPTAIKLSMAEAEAVRTLFYNNARQRAGAAATGLSEIGGEDLAKAYRTEAQVVGDHIDNAITQAIKDRRLPSNARADLVGARDLWKQWKQGETLIDEIMPAIKSAGREGAPMTSGDIFSALDRIDKMEAKFNGTLISGTQRSYLTGMARAMKAAEESGQSKMFSWMVRGNQANLVIGGGALAAGHPEIAAVSAAIALTPSLMNFITTNRTAASLLIRGMRLEPGTAAAARTSREFLTLLASNGYVAPPTRPGDEE